VPEATQQHASHTLLRFVRQATVVFSLGVYALLSPAGYLLFTLLGALPTADPLRRTRRLQRITTGAYRLVHGHVHRTRVVDFDPRQALPDLPAGPFVLVANHPTLMDVTALLAALGGGITVIKPALFKRRLLRPLLAGAGHLEGPGDAPLGTGPVLDAAVERLAQGFRVVIFPEGTRSPPDKLLPFGRAAFEIACRARVPVVSVGIRCNPPWLTKEVGYFSLTWPPPALRLEVLASDDPARVDWDSRRLRKKVEARFHSWFRNGTPAEPTTGRPSAPKDSPCPNHSKIA
jgi:1-acyl-sn-glycerol-3-phosphate acyltransferase